MRQEVKILIFVDDILILLKEKVDFEVNFMVHKKETSENGKVQFLGFLLSAGPFRVEIQEEKGNFKYHGPKYMERNAKERILQCFNVNYKNTLLMQEKNRRNFILNFLRRIRPVIEKACLRDKFDCLEYAKKLINRRCNCSFKKEALKRVFPEFYLKK